MLSHNVLTTFSFEKRDFLLVSGGSRLKFNPYSVYFLMEGRVTSLSDLCTEFTKRLVEQMFIYKI